MGPGKSKSIKTKPRGRVWALQRGSVYIPLAPSLQERDVISQYLRRFLQQRFKHASDTIYTKVCKNCLNPGKHKPTCQASQRGDQKGRLRRVTFAVLNGGPHDIPPEFFPSPSLPAPSVSSSPPTESVPTPIPEAPTTPITSQAPAVENCRTVTDDDVLSTSNVFLAALFEYARALIAIQLKKMPHIQNRKPKNGSEDWMARAGVTSNRFPFPEASTLRNHPDLKKFFLTAVAFACEEASVELCDLESYFHLLLPEGGLLCHCGELLSREGYVSNLVLVRCANLAFKFLLAVRYRCVKCNNPNAGSVSSTCTSLCPSVWKQLGDTELAHKLSFPLTGPKLDFGLITMAETVVCHGGSFSAVVKGSAETIFAALARRSMQRLTLAKRISSVFNTFELKGDEVTAFTEVLVPRAANLIEAVRIKAVGSASDGNLAEGLHQASFLVGMKNLDTFAFDQTHFGTDKLGQMAYQNVLAPTGEVLVSQAQEGTSLSLSKHAFKYMDSESPNCLGAYLDNPKSFITLLQQVNLCANNMM
jgi:hypothetical protein